MNNGKIKVEGKEYSPTCNIAIWETYAHIQKVKYWDLIQKKAKRVKHLQSNDFFNLTNKEIQKAIKQIEFLEAELEIFVSYSEAFENLQKAYLETSVWLSDYWTKKVSTYYEIQLTEHWKNYNSLLEVYGLMTNEGRKYLTILIGVLEECQKRNIKLNSLKNITL